jgi:hypothetical protein
VSCRTAHRSPATLFVAVVALSAVAFVGQALAASASTEMTTVAAHAAALAAPR